MSISINSEKIEEWEVKTDGEIYRVKVTFTHQKAQDQLTMVI